LSRRYPNQLINLPTDNGLVRGDLASP